MVLENIEKLHYYTCDATDEKPTKDILKDSILKIDGTDEEYIFNGTEWIKNFFTLGNNGLRTITNESIEIAGFSLKRAKITIQNQGVEPVLIKINGTASINDYDYRIATGKEFVSDILKLPIYGATPTGNSVISILEEVLQ